MAGIAQGTVFGGRYIVQSQIGSGGMATVYRGVDSRLDRQVAIKVMLSQYANDPAFAQRFKQEAQAAAALQNPYIVAVYDWGRDEATGTYYIVMEYLRGTDLKTGIRSRGALAPRKVAQIGAQVCSALSVAHAHDIIHRDIKPQNIMIQPNGDAKVMDFGIARAKNSHLTQTNSVLGTAHYVSPEQAQGKELDATSDLYSLGVVMYEAATGKLPFDGDDAVSVALKQVNEQAVPPSQVNPNVDDGLEAIIMCCMSKDPRQRFQSADELRRTLNNYINGRPLGIPTFSGAAPTTRLAGSAGTTQLVKPGSAGRTAAMHPGTTGTQRMARETERIGGTQRMAAGGTRQGSGAGGMGGRGGYDVAAQEGPGGPGRGAVIGIIVAVVVVVVIAMLFALTSCGSCAGGGTDDQQGASTTQDGKTDAAATEKVEVPDLSGLTADAAKTKLESEGLKLGTIVEQTDSDTPKGQVISSSPKAGVEVAEGTSVNIVVSSGPASATLPTLTKGMSAEEVESKLKAAGFVPQHDESLDGYDAETAEGTFLRIDAATQNSTQLKQGATVKYGLSKGVDPATLKATVPEVTGWYYTDAENSIAGSELNYYEAWEYSDSAAWGTVIRTDPASGTELDKGSTVTIYISNGKQPVQISDYTGWSAGTAEAAIRDLGLNAVFDYSTPAPDAASEGLVYRTDPGAGGEVEAGGTVTVYAYGSYVPPTGAVPGDIETYGIAGALSTLQGMGFTNVSVSDGTSFITSGYENYTLQSIDYAGQSVTYDTPIVIHVTKNAPSDPETPEDGGTSTNSVE